MPVPRVVIDTSVFIAGLLTKNKLSNPAQIISMWRGGAFILVISPQILKELVAKLIDKEMPELLVIDFVKTIAQIALHIPGACETIKLNNIDPSDNIFLAASYESKADYLVSLDKISLLPMKHFHGTTIYTPELFVRSLMGLTYEERK